MLEKEIESAVVSYAKQHNYLTYKFNSPSNRAVPDRIFISPTGVLTFVEFKRKGLKLTDLQAVIMRKLANYKMNVFLIDDIDIGKAFIDGYAKYSIQDDTVRLTNYESLKENKDDYIRTK